MTLCDSGFLICLAEPKEPKSDDCKRLVSDIKGPLTTTWPCIAESMYSLGRRGGGWRKQKFVAELILNGFLIIYETEKPDYSRLFSLMEQYQDVPMDLADASLVYTAERTGDPQILTFDSDFFFYRINNRDSFDVLEV